MQRQLRNRRSVAFLTDAEHERIRLYCEQHGTTLRELLLKATESPPDDPEPALNPEPAATAPLMTDEQINEFLQGIGEATR